MTIVASAIHGEPVRRQIATSQKRVSRRLERGLTDAACVGQVVEPRTEQHPQDPENPVEGRADGIAADVRGWTDEW